MNAILSLILSIGMMCNWCVIVADVSATKTPQGVVIRWETVNEFQTIGFNIYRSRCETCKLVKVNDTIIQSSCPGSLFGDVYKYRTKGHRRAYYWLSTIDFEMNETFYPIGRPTRMK